jgi:PadR family transcriptional regulator, regulatory protein PadR
MHRRPHAGVLSSAHAAYSRRYVSPSSRASRNTPTLSTATSVALGPPDPEQLERGPRHGYQLALEIEERSGGYFPFNHGTLYPILHRLEKEGWIAGSWTDPEQGRPRKEYGLTEAGRTQLGDLLEEWRALSVRLAALLEQDGESDEQVRTGVA